MPEPLRDNFFAVLWNWFSEFCKNISFFLLYISILGSRPVILIQSKHKWLTCTFWNRIDFDIWGKKLNLFFFTAFVESCFSFFKDLILVNSFLFSVVIEFVLFCFVGLNRSLSNFCFWINHFPNVVVSLQLAGITRHFDSCWCSIFGLKFGDFLLYLDCLLWMIHVVLTKKKKSVTFPSSI